MIKWLKKKFQKKRKFLIWGIIEGPIRSEDIPDSPYGPGSVLMIMRFSDGSKVGDAEFWFDSFDDAYKIVKHFHYSIEPIQMNAKDFDIVQ